MNTIIGRIAVALILCAAGIANAATAIVHYQRPGGDYAGWSLHVWGTGLAAGEATGWTSPKAFSGSDAFGRSATIQVSNTAAQVGFVIHSGDLKDTANDRFFVPANSPEIWIRQGDATVHTSNPSSVTPGTLTINYCRPNADYAGWGLHLWGGGLAAGVATSWSSPRLFSGSSTPVSAAVQLANIAKPVNFIVHQGDNKDVATDRTYTPRNASDAIWLAQGDATIHTAKPAACNGGGAAAYRKPGADYSATQTTFALWSPDRSDVRLWLDGTQHTMTKAPNVNGYTDVYAVTVPGNHHLKRYHFIVSGTTVRDPYGVMVDAGSNDNVVLDLSQTEPAGGWAAVPPLVNREDAVIYEMHVRDFTIDASSGVDAARRGKFLGMVQAGTTVNGSTKTGIDHLVELGVTHVQILPFYDFASCSPADVAADPNCYNWGYDPANFNVPEERYSMTPADPVNRVRELKTMVNEFHKRGIRVVMDVVYNHSFAKEMFQGISGQYYTATDLSGTGNSINSGVPMVSRMIRDSLEYWAREYRIDGFRFDLVGVFHTAAVGDWARTLNTSFPGRNLLIYGEPWNGFAADAEESQKVRLGTVGTLVDAHVGVFNSKFREALKGSSDNGNAGGLIFAQGGTWGSGPLGPISAGNKASIRFANQGGALPDLWDPMFALDPEQSINYVDAHDNLCLNDKVEAWAQAEAARSGYVASAGHKRRIQEYAMAAVLLAQGVPFLHGGSEMLRTKFGDHNSYRSPDSVNKIRWNWKVDNRDTFDYVKALIALRRAHPGLRMTSWSQVNANVQSNQASKDLIVTSINGAAAGDGWSEMLMIQNSGGNIAYPLPAGTWNVIVERSAVNAAPRQVSGSVTAEGTATTLLYR